jgi:hypothetical protein
MSTPRDPDEHADRLRDVLRAEGDAVTPGGDGLMRIRERIEGHGMRNRWLVPVGIASAAALVAGGVVGGLALAGNDSDDARVGVITGTPSATPSPKPTAVAPPSPNGTPWFGPITTVPVYYLHDTGTAIRLYREFHLVSATGSKNHPEAALHDMFQKAALDDDYTTIWPQGTDVLDVRIAGSVATVNLSAAVKGPFNGGTEGAQLSIQQVVWTVTAADNTVKSVVFQVGGKPVTTLLGVDVSKPQKRDASYTVLGAVWVLAPKQGETVHSPVKFSGQATVFEANVSIQILRGGKVVKQTHTTATTGGPGRGDWKLTVVLTPGTYVIRGYETSAKDGSMTNVDDKTFTVK